MYESHWGLSESPFRVGNDPKRFYQSPTHEEALARLHFLVETRRRLGLLLGDAGSGKSLLLAVFAEQLRRLGQSVATVSLLGADPAELPSLLALALRLPVDRCPSNGGVWRLLTDHIAENRYQHVATVFLLDDADRASPSVLSRVLRLAKCDPAPDSRLTLVLAGQYDRMGRLGPDLLDLADLRIDLEPWELADTEAFVRWALSRAGRTDQVFDAPAISRLHELAGGVPRRVCQLAELALVAGAGQHLAAVDTETVESACRELGVIEV
ncbi:MAG: AAA family ATPase [Thermoguttaceae bacterium]|jgi:general secretion pathway protein A|nr:AAA family ATPase [Thermoguttaceae bacterium]